MCSKIFFLIFECKKIWLLFTDFNPNNLHGRTYIYPATTYLQKYHRCDTFIQNHSQGYYGKTVINFYLNPYSHTRMTVTLVTTVRYLY